MKMFCRLEDIKDYLENLEQKDEKYYRLYHNTIDDMMDKDMTNDFLNKYREKILDLIECYIKENADMLLLGKDFGQSDRDIEMSIDFMYDLVVLLTEKFTESIEQEINYERKYMIL